MVTLDKNPIFVQNTCAFDTIVEVFTTAYCNYSTFKLTVDASNSQIFSFVKKYATEGVSQSLYKKRAEILRSTYPIENGYMNCYGSLTSLLTSLLKNDPCLVTTKNCFKCGIIKEEKPTIDYFEELPDINNFKQNFVEFLTKKIREISEEECHICKSKVTVNKKLSGLLIFDVEDLFQVLISKFPDGVQIADMPDEILVQNNKYFLVGIYRHIPAHFTAFCRETNGLWKEFDDQWGKPRCVKNSKMVTLTPLCLLYSQ